MFIPNTRNCRRQRTVGDRNKQGSSSLSRIVIHVAIATIYSILRTTEAFRMPVVKRIGISPTPSEQIGRTIIRSSSSSLCVLSSPRRRTNYSNNIKIPSPIEFNPNLMINFNEKNGNDKTPMSLPPPDSATTSIIQAPPAETISPHNTQVGAASKSALFRRQHSSATKEHSQGDDHLFPSSIIPTTTSTIQLKPNKTNMLRTRRQKRKRKQYSSKIPTFTEITTVEELNQYWPRCLEEGEDLDEDEHEDCLLPQDETANSGRPLDYNQLLRGMSVKGDTQIIGSKDRPDFVHPVVRLMHERKKEQSTNPQCPKKKKEKIALVVEGGGMRGCVSAGMVCAIHCLGLSDTIDVVYGSSAGAVIAAYFVSKQLPYYGPEVYYDSLTTLENKTASKTKPEQAAGASSQNNHVVDRYDNDYFIDLKRMTRSMGLGLCDPRLLKDVWTRRVHGKPMMNLHYMFQNIMLKKKPIDYETFVKRQTIQPLKIVATGLSSEKPVILSHEDGHFDTVEDLCNSLHASCLLPGIAGPVMNVLKRIRRGNKTKTEVTANTIPKKHPGSTGTKLTQHQHQQEQKPNFVLRNTHRELHQNDKDYEPLGDAMLSAPIPYDIAHDEGATHVLVIRSSPDGTNLLAAPSVMAWIGSMIFKRYFLKKNHLPGMYKRSQTEQRHQRVYAKTILELNNRANSPPPSDSKEHQTMTIALEPGSDEVSHLEITREGIFKGVRQGFARAYDALVEDPDKRGRGEEMALLYFPDEILDYDPNDTRLSSSSSSSSNSASAKTSKFRSAFEEYLSSTDVVPKTWLDDNRNGHIIP